MIKTSTLTCDLAEFTINNSVVLAHTSKFRASATVRPYNLFDIFTLEVKSMRGSCRYSCVVLILTAFAMQLLAVAAPAQQRFTPDHPEVEEMVRKGLEGVRANVPNGIQRRVLAALTIVECAKRYDNTNPVDDPLVVSAVEEVVNDVNQRRMERESEIYYPAIALILLCEVGDTKYPDEIKAIIDLIVSRQEPQGGIAYLRDRGSGYGDTSQTQYAALALWVAHNRGFYTPLDSVNKMLEFYLESNLANGSWYYTYLPNGGPTVDTDIRLSIHTASIGSVYLLADFLQLSPRSSRRKKGAKNDIAKAIEEGTGLPPSVTVYVPPKSGVEFDQSRNKTGPLVRANMTKLSAVKRAGNQYLKENFEIAYDQWGYYYLYALERYAHFREKTEGSFREVPDWYDQGVDLLKSLQEEDGSFAKLGKNREQNAITRTCFAVLFLVRASEILVQPSASGNLNGGLGLRSNVRLDLVDGKIKSFDVINGLSDVLQLLDSGEVDDQQFELIQDSLAKSISQLGSSNKRSRREQLAYLRGFVSDRNYYKRLIAVKLLSRQQDMNNVPALIYALGDPDLRICAEAHNGLRLISRKLDSITVPTDAGFADYQNVKRQWTDWFLRIRPGAELLD